MIPKSSMKPINNSKNKLNSKINLQKLIFTKRTPRDITFYKSEHGPILPRGSTCVLILKIRRLLLIALCTYYFPIVFYIIFSNYNLFNAIMLWRRLHFTWQTMHSFLPFPFNYNIFLLCCFFVFHLVLVTKIVKNMEGYFFNTQLIFFTKECTQQYDVQVGCQCLTQPANMTQTRHGFFQIRVGP